MLPIAAAAPPHLGRMRPQIESEDDVTSIHVSISYVCMFFDIDPCSYCYVDRLATSYQISYT